MNPVDDICNLLNEYTRICIELNKMKDRIVNVRNITKYKLLSAKSSDEKLLIFQDYKTQIQKCKLMSSKYKSLKKQRIKLYIELIDRYKKTDSYSDAKKDLQFLLKKYSDKSNFDFNFDFSDDIDDYSGGISEISSTIDISSSDESINSTEVFYDKNTSTFTESETETSTMKTDSDYYK